MAQAELTIRDYVDADLEAVLACFSRSVHVIGARYYTPEQTAVWAPEHLDREAWRKRFRTGRTLIADVGGAVAGFARVEESGYIDVFYVDPRFERQGIGWRLLEEACAWARARGPAQLTSDVSLAARPLFERMGFAVEREQTVERSGVKLTNFRMSRKA